MMLTYFIAGVPNCPDFGHVKLVAEKLKHSLPYFSYKVIAVAEGEYQNWLRNFCNRQKWKANKNPLVWKRISRSNDKCYLIGGLNEFFEHIVEYYNIDTCLDERVKKHIALDNQERMSLMLKEEIPRRRPTPRKVCITGAIYPSTCFLVSELLQLKQLCTKGGIMISLHQKNMNRYEDLIKIKNEMNNLVFNIQGQCAVTAVNSVEEGLLNCDLLIVIGDLNKDKNQAHHLWMNLNYNSMRSLASILNRHCPRQCKVLLMGMDQLCFNLSVLAENTEKVYLYNLVGVTSHYGMEMLPNISRATKIPISDLHCPPVWGFIGTRKFIDVCQTTYHSKPADCGFLYSVDATAVHGSASQKYHKCLHTILMQFKSEGLVDTINDSDENLLNIECPFSCLPEVRATVRLISEWFESKKNITISAAVFSDGTFGLPFGMFMSQPVCMENGEWKPNFDFPSPDENILKYIVSRVTETLIEYNLGKRFNMKWRESMSQLSEI